MAENNLSTPSLSQGNKRMSFAANTTRQSLGPPRIKNNNQNINNELAGMSLDQRKMSIGRSSIGRKNSIGGVGRFSSNSRDSTGRRSSTYPASSFNAGNKDPRPIREKQYQLEVIKNLINFLAKSGFQHPISQKILTAPSAKDFQNIFKFLYSQIDPCYEFGKKFEDEVPLLMRGLKYPFAGEISKNQLYAVGSMHAWPGLLAMLGWMVELINCCDLLSAQQENPMGNEMSDSIMATEDNNSSEKIFFDYLCKTYKVFLAGSDDFEPLVSELGNSFDRQNESTLREIEDLNEVVSELDQEYQKLIKSEDPLSKTQREHSVYAGDVEKFEKFISHLKIKQEKFSEAIKTANFEISNLEKEIEEFEIQRSSLQAQVDAQDICPEDIDKMNLEKDQLMKTMDSLKSNKEECNKMFWERELLVQKKLDTVERLVYDYNRLAEKLAIIPKEASLSSGLDLVLSFNPHATQADEILNLNIENSVYPALTTIRENCYQSTIKFQEDFMKYQEVLDKLKENCSDKIAFLSDIERKVERLLQSYNEEKEAFSSENMRADSEAEQLSDTIQKLKSDLSSQSLYSQQRLQWATVSYDQLLSELAVEKEKIGSQIYRILEELINFKTSIESSLQDLESKLGHETE